jgi:sensor histidine kinase YesM
MAQTNTISLSQKQRWILTAVLMVIAAMLIYSFIRSYVTQMNNRQDEEISLAATLGIFVCVYAGRFISLLWLSDRPAKNRKLLIWLPIIMIIALIACAAYGSMLVSYPTAFALLLLILSAVLGCLALGAFIKLLRHDIYSQIRAANTMAVNSQAELQLLQSQLSPHFLFNTLNNLYGVSLTHPDKVPALLLKLSDLLRYSVYDASDAFVPLKHEVEYLRNFIDFEQMRIGNRLDLKLHLEEIYGNDLKVAPMLLIIFLENAFKHAKDSVDERIFVEIALKTWGRSLLYSVKNSHGKGIADTSTAVKAGGLGLENVKKRLELLYPKDHTLEIQEDDKWYTVLLQLKLR